eukprot:TRINITY_DN59_c0_g1_i7.p1 TRINITY_DN59_c0_g1~~TRINITY_DN59_c0_g1_i7.p1  ORF type:complete len:562 (-),score=68.14 TRINITY_DN59_c0_g1_i7:1141-2826(-)
MARRLPGTIRSPSIFRAAERLHHCRRFSNARKAQLLDEFRASGKTATDFEEEKNLFEGAVRRWGACESRIRSAPADHMASGVPERYAMVNARVLQWLVPRFFLEGDQTSPSMIRRQAKIIAEELKLPKFKASSGWIRQLARRHALVAVVLHGERASADVAAAQAYAGPHFQDMMRREGVTPRRTFNADETLGFYRQRRRKTIVPVGMRRRVRGVKQDLASLGVLTVIGAGGDVGSLLFTGKPRVPRGMESFADLDDGGATLDGRVENFLYAQTPIGWVSRAAFNLWLIHAFVPFAEVHCRHIQETSRVLLLIDGCPVHFTALLELWRTCCGGAVDVDPAKPAQISVADPGVIVNRGLREPSGAPRDGREVVVRGAIAQHGADITVRNLTVKVRFLPPNTTSLMQPCDMGWIRRLKQAWSRHMDEMISLTPGGQSIKDMQSFDAADYIAQVTEAAMSVPRPEARKHWDSILHDIGSHFDTAREHATRLEEQLAILLARAAEPDCSGQGDVADALAAAAAGQVDDAGDDDSTDLSEAGDGCEDDLDAVEDALVSDVGTDDVDP